MSDDSGAAPAVLSLWFVRARTTESDSVSHIIALAVSGDGQRIPSVEKRDVELLHRSAGNPVFTLTERERLLRDALDPTLQRELRHRGIVSQTGGYSAELMGWVELS